MNFDSYRIERQHLYLTSWSEWNQEVGGTCVCKWTSKRNNCQLHSSFATALAIKRYDTIHCHHPYPFSSLFDAHRHRHFEQRWAPSAPPIFENWIIRIGSVVGINITMPYTYGNSTSIRQIYFSLIPLMALSALIRGYSFTDTTPIIAARQPFAQRYRSYRHRNVHRTSGLRTSPNAF